LRESYYFDSSVLVKLYVLERGSHWVRRLIEPSQGSWHTVLSSKLSIVETTSAFFKRRRQGLISESLKQRLVSRFLYDIQHRYLLTAPTDDVLTLAVDLLQRHPLRAYDAVQLATALVVNRKMHSTQQRDRTLIFVSADGVLCQVAQAEGLIAENPNAYGAENVQTRS
jgi:predicted nucleic acid-binding protein